MGNDQGFYPDWASPPGETIAELLSERKLTLREFASHMGQTLPQARKLLEGKLPITIQIARQLELVVGASVSFWMNRDYQYHQDVERADMEKEWLSELPVQDMLSFGWIRRPDMAMRRAAPFLEFFDVPDVSTWHDRYANVRALAAFRTSKTFESDAAAVTAWLREGEIRAASIKCANWEPDRFRDCLESARQLTRLSDPARFLPRLQELCSEAGVAVVVIRAPNGCRASGATRFITRTKALLLLSVRHRSDDHFWFTFFHEAGHLLLHSKASLFVDGFEPSDSAEEKEADEFAEAALIPESFRRDLDKLRTEWRTVTRFALELGISPGIVVGQLQHRGRLRHDQLNYLKRHYTWKD